jgi:hypothetical protein
MDYYSDKSKTITVQREKHTFQDGWYYWSEYRPGDDPKVSYTYFNNEGEEVSESTFNARFDD